MVGQRNCIGKGYSFIPRNISSLLTFDSLAWAEMQLILSSVFWRFELELTDNNVEDWTKQKIFLTHQKLPLMVRVHRME